MAATSKQQIPAFDQSGSSPPQWIVDVLVENHGTLFLFRPLSSRGHEWLASNTDANAQWFGEALVVEHRYARDVAYGAINDGLAVR